MITTYHCLTMENDLPLLAEQPFSDKIQNALQLITKNYFKKCKYAKYVTVHVTQALHRFQPLFLFTILNHLIISSAYIMKYLIIQNTKKILEGNSYHCSGTSLYIYELCYQLMVLIHTNTHTLKCVSHWFKVLL